MVGTHGTDDASGVELSACPSSSCVDEAPPRDSTPPPLFSEEKKRERWKGRLSFWLAAIGSAVGIGNLWRFPSLCFEYGGGAFFIPYVIALFVIGIPLLTLEFAIGQCFQGGHLAAFNHLSKRFRGVGVAAVFVGFMVTCYYTVILSWGLRYCVSSFYSPYPWEPTSIEATACASLATPQLCYAYPYIKDPEIVLPEVTTTEQQMQIRLLGEAISETSAQDSGIGGGATDDVSKVDEGSRSQEPTAEKGTCKWIKAAQEQNSKCVADIDYKARTYFADEVVGMDTTSFPELRGFVVLGLAVVWLSVFIALYKGVLSTGIVVYVTMTVPIALLLLLVIRGVLLEGAYSGLVQYMGRWDFSILWEQPDVWSKAVGQIYFSIGVGYGVMTAYASYNKTNQNVAVDTLVVSLSNSAVSLLAGVAVFSVAGYLATVTGKLDENGDPALAQLRTSGPELVFILYPLALSTIPYSNWLSVIFFLMFFLLGVDSAFALAEAMVTMLADCQVCRKLKLPRWGISAVICVFGMTIGLPYCTSLGPYLLDSVDNYMAIIASVFIGGCQALAAGWIYGSGRQAARIGYKPILVFGIGFFLFGALGITIGFNIMYNVSYIGVCVGACGILASVSIAIFLVPPRDGVTGQELTLRERTYVLLLYNIDLLREEVNSLIASKTCTGTSGCCACPSCHPEFWPPSDAAPSSFNCSFNPGASAILPAAAELNSRLSPPASASTSAPSTAGLPAEDGDCKTMSQPAKPSTTGRDSRIWRLCGNLISGPLVMCRSLTILFSITIKFIIPLAMMTLLGQTFSRHNIETGKLLNLQLYPLYIHIIGIILALIAVGLIILGWVLPEVYKPLLPQTDLAQSHLCKKTSTPCWETLLSSKHSKVNASFDTDSK